MQNLEIVNHISDVFTKIGLQLILSAIIAGALLDVLTQEGWKRKLRAGILKFVLYYHFAMFYVRMGFYMYEDSRGMYSLIITIGILIFSTYFVGNTDIRNKLDPIRLVYCQTVLLVLVIIIHLKTVVWEKVEFLYYNSDFGHNVEYYTILLPVFTAALISSNTPSHEKEQGNRKPGERTRSSQG